MKIGVTGHQQLPAEKSWDWFRARLRELVEDRRPSISAAYSCLAEGADQEFAQVVLAAGIPLVAVIPCDRYEGAFQNPDALGRYKSLLRQAAEVIRLSYDSPSEDAFMAGGRKVADSVDLLLALWDGKQTPSNGGTDDAVAYAVSNAVKVLHLNPVTEACREL